MAVSKVPKYLSDACGSLTIFGLFGVQKRKMESTKVSKGVKTVSKVDLVMDDLPFANGAMGYVYKPFEIEKLRD